LSTLLVLESESKAVLTGRQVVWYLTTQSLLWLVL